MTATTTTLVTEEPTIVAEDLSTADRAVDRAAEGAQPAAPPAQPGNAAVTNAPQGRENAFAITSFVLGIASIVSGWTLIAPIVGLVFGVLALRRRTTERTLALWGVWLNVAMLALTALVVIVMLIVVGFALIVGLPVFADAAMLAG